MQNIEIKARIHDPDAAHRTAREVADQDNMLELEQTDTYFLVQNGRLKLREERGPAAVHKLVYYNRPDQPGPGLCNYELLPVPDPDAMKHILGASLGVRVIVEKHRTVYFHKNVRIHIDNVRGLGAFLEFEAVMASHTPPEHGEPLVHKLLKKFNISETDLIEVSYCDMVDPL